MAEFKDVADQVRDIAEVPAVEVITTTAVHLMSAAAIQCGLGEDGGREPRGVADREAVEDDVVLVALERRGRRQHELRQGHRPEHARF